MGAVTANATIRALVPVKRLARAKSRLAAVCSDEERRLLAEAMLRDVLDALSRSRRLAGVVVVTSDAAVAAIAKDHDARAIGDSDEAGINAAVRLGLNALAADGCAGALIVPGDIPFLNAGEIDLAASALTRPGVVIAPALRDGGTNLLGLAPLRAMAPAFGPDSFARHLARARAAGIEPVVLSLEGAGHDIDVPADLWRVASPGAGDRTRRLLARINGFEGPARSGSTREASPPCATQRF